MQPNKTGVEILEIIAARVFGHNTICDWQVCSIVPIGRGGHRLSVIRSKVQPSRF